MKVRNMTGSAERAIANQFIIETSEMDDDGDYTYEVEYFQSYESIIVKRIFRGGHAVEIQLDMHHWDCSTTTGKYRNQFLGENKRETERKIKSGEYKLVNLN